MTETPSTEPDGDPAVQPYTDPVEEEGARFAREGHVDEADRRATGSGTDDLSPDFLEPDQPS